jgi:hypothetical protein
MMFFGTPPLGKDDNPQDNDLPLPARASAINYEGH